MMTRRELFKTLAGAVIGVSVAPAVVKAAPRLAFHPDAFWMTTASLDLCKSKLAPLTRYTGAVCYCPECLRSRDEDWS